MPEKKKHKWDVAISYAGENRKIAESLVASLKAKDRTLSVFYNRTHKSYLWGKDEKEYENIYGPESRFVVPIISKYYKKKDWPLYEFSAALKEAKKRKEEFILPIRVDDSQLLGLRNGVNYMDIREDGIKEIAKILVDKCKMLSKKGKNNRSNVNDQICILSRKSRYVLGIITTSIFFTKLIEFSRIFPDVKWQRELNWLSRKGLVIKKKHSLDIPKTVKNAVLRDPEDIKEFNQAWIKALKPFQDHIDVAIMLSLHYLHIDEFNQAVSISANMVERMEPSWWSRLYLTLLKGMTRKKILARIKPYSRIRLYNAMGLSLSHTGKNAEAVKWFLKLRRYSLSCKNKWGTGQSYINCGVAYHKSANHKKAKACYLQAIKHARRVKDDLLLGYSLNNLSQIVAEDSFEEAEKLIKESILVKKNRKNYGGLATSYGTLGYLAARSGKYEEARKWFLQAQKKAEILKLGYLESLSFFNIGNVYFDLKEFDNACYYYLRSYRVAEKNGYSEIIEMNVEGEAKACFEMGWFRKSELKFRRLLELTKNTDQDSRKLIALEGISASLMRQRNILEARKILRKALKLAYNLKNLDLIIKLSIYKALTYDGGKLGKTAIKILENEIANAQRSKKYLIAIKLWIVCIAELINLKDTNRIAKAFKNGTYCLNKLDNNYEIKIRFYAYLHFWQWYTGNHKAGIETLKRPSKCYQAERGMSSRTWAIK
jgi:tetratricopeptide (TPR) repeat protein